MAERTLEPTKATRSSTPGAGEAAAAADGDAGAAAEKGAKAVGFSSSFKAWLPLLVTVSTMPFLAWGTTRYFILPKLQYAMSHPAAAAASSSSEATPAPAEGVTPGKTKISVPMSKMLVNVSGTMGTRYLMTSLTLVGTAADFKSKIEDNRDQLMDLATSTLSSKTIADLEKPGARNVIRAELMTVFNNALGGPVVQELYITEMAIQ
jgi:flagellar FliL protein